MITKREEGITDATGSLRHDDALERVRQRAISHRCEDAAPRVSALAYDRSGAVRRVGAEELESFVQTVRLALYKAGGESLEESAHCEKARNLPSGGDFVRNLT